ncbi:SDR family NAD(P)-dependent oxidoreductase [Caenispirillum bisanense]|uniref:NADP-dependent 3-hydroxy acid dehydrogenase YdfG n=1 Tax=Caenispirillum bisanense TaxID=414052 RepID=A0A286GWI7_9PROT|nr:SDR family NAD(P)-dependent oxidoreductase [Caenispirillum bisanense]SOD99905.1 NADP-dependent 3-hydroxy acid dehydrogenase YdfG [Caenispirillum bisanense]
MTLEDTPGIVTGAASGLGRAVAARLAAAGARVVLLDLDEDAVTHAAAALGERARPAVADVRDPAAVTAALDLCGEAFGAVRFAVNCAGVPSSAKIVSRGAAHDLDLWRRVIDINLTGTFNVMRLAAERMVANTPDPATGERGVIVNTASVAAFDGQRGQAAYAASKAAIVGLSLPVARDLQEHAVRCVAIAPGLFETPIFDAIPATGVAALQRSLLYPDRLGDPAEFADLVHHVIGNPYVNATCYRLDGGARLS